MHRLFGIVLIAFSSGCAEKGIAPPLEQVPRVVLNELMARNETTLTDDEGDFDDWIELVNLGGDAVPFEELRLSDRIDDPTPWTPLRAAPLDPGERVLIWADDETDEGPLHADFKLSAAGDTLVLRWAHDGAIIDSVSFGPLAPDQAYARMPDGEGAWTPTDSPTPGESNQ